jgi:DNA-binding LacI/PurR family transcriptional regulator
MATLSGGPGPPAGLRDVAGMAGVSVATASLALNGQPGVADSTRRRIVAAAEQLGYHANLQAQPLRRGRATTYEFVVRNFANPFFLEVLSGAQQVAAESGATVFVLDSRYSIERERRHVQEMAVQRVAGLAMAQVGLAVHRLAELGHTCIGFLSAPRGLMADPDRLRHFRLLAGALDLQPRVMYSLLTMADVQLAAGRVLSGPGAPTAIITNSDYSACDFQGGQGAFAAGRRRSVGDRP